MYKSILLAAVIILSSFHTISKNESIMKAAQSGMSKYIGLIPAGRENLYGFSAGENMQNCTVGKPFQMLSLNAAYYKENYVEGKNYLVLQNEWRVPVILNGENRTLLTVDYSKGNYTVVNMSGADLSRELQQISAAADNDADLYILREYQLHADFFVVSRTSSLADASFIPLSSAVIAMPSLKNKQSYSLREVLTNVKTTLTYQPKN